MIIYDPKIAILLIAFNRSNIKQVFDRIKVVKPRRLYIAVDGSIEPLHIPSEHFNISHQVVGEGDGLGPLQMRVARHNGFGMFAGHIQQCKAKSSYQILELHGNVLNVKTHIGGNLIDRGGRQRDNRKPCKY